MHLHNLAVYNVCNPQKQKHLADMACIVWTYTFERRMTVRRDWSLGGGDELHK